MLMIIVQALGYILAALLAYVGAILIIAYIRSLRYPEKSYLYSVINVALGPLRAIHYGPFKYGKITMASAIKSAMKRANLDDFGGSEFINNHDTLMSQPFYKSLRYTNLGYIMGRKELVDSLKRRLLMVQYLKDVPDVLKIPVRSPVFVTGLPRTGTTYLHKLLSLDPATRSPLLWELLEPTPKKILQPGEPVSFEEDRKKRLQKVKKIVEMRDFLGDTAMAHIHEIGAELPEECLMLLASEMPLNLQFLYPDYFDGEKILALSLVRAYEDYRKGLQLLSYQCDEAVDPRTWVLKCPIHILFLNDLEKVFPDAKIIWTHRHPVSAVPSLLSLLKSTAQTYYENETRQDATLGKTVARITQRVLEKASNFLKKESKMSCSHVIYNDLIADPIGTVRKIYKEIGREFTPQYESILKEYVVENRKAREKLKADAAKKGFNDGKTLHKYEPADFALTEEELTEGYYEQYIKDYNIPISRG